MGFADAFGPFTGRLETSGEKLELRDCPIGQLLMLFQKSSQYLLAFQLKLLKKNIQFVEYYQKN